MKIENYDDQFTKSTFTLGDLQHNKQRNTKNKKGKKGKKKQKNAFNSNENFNIIDASECFRHAAEYHAATTSEESKPSNSTEKEQFSQPTAAEPDSLFGYSELLQQKVDLINVDNKLYYHSGKCYLPLNKRELIRLYRRKVDYTLHGATSLSHISPLYSFLLSDPNIITETEENQYLCTLENGIYDVQNKRLYPHSPEFITFSYVKSKYIKHPDCPHFEKFLAETFDDDEALIERVWQMLGYIFMHTNDGKCFFVMGEAPNSGKSLLGNFVQNLFPQEHVSNIALNDFNGKYSLVKLVGAAVNVSLDLPSSELKPTAVSKLKMLTGGDVINAEEKYEPSFSFKNSAKLLFASNYPVKISEADEAFWNRLIYIPFNKSIPHELQDKTLLDKFISEKDSIVTIALRHAKSLIDNNFVFPTTPEIERKMAQFSNATLPTVKEFIDEKCEIDSQFKGEPVQVLYEAYKSFCDENGFSADSYNAFKAQFEKLTGIKHTKKRFVRPNPISGFGGVRLIS